MENTYSHRVPSWNLHQFYPSLDCTELTVDIEEAVTLVTSLEDISQKLEDLLDDYETVNREDGSGADKMCEDLSSTATNLLQLRNKCLPLLWDLREYTECYLRLDHTDDHAHKLHQRMEDLFLLYDQAIAVLNRFLTTSSEDLFKRFTDQLDGTGRFIATGIRERASARLSVAEEKLATQLKKVGFDAWYDLYISLHRQIPRVMITVPAPDGSTSQMPAVRFLMGCPDERLRREAHQAVYSFWKRNRDTCAAVLNALTGWKLSLCTARMETGTESQENETGGSRTTFPAAPVFLRSSLRKNHMSYATLEAMLHAVHEFRTTIQNVFSVKAHCIHKEALDPWDNFMPAPAPPEKRSNPIPYSEALRLISSGFSHVHHDMGDFVYLMDRQQLIDAGVGDNRRPGACSSIFCRAQTPLVFLSGYRGDLSSINSLAHELGHAFHSWSMRGAPWFYPMSIPDIFAETASSFAELAVSKALCESTDSPDELFRFYWQRLSMTAVNLTFIPMLFSFDMDLFTRRQKGPVPADEIDEILTRQWNDWLGDSFSRANSLLWVSHVLRHKADFHTYPYIFGALFSHGLYHLWEEREEAFYPAFTAFLSDSGRMGAEDLVKRHMGEDITKPAFWNRCLQVVEKNIDTFGKLVDKLQVFNN